MFEYVLSGIPKLKATRKEVPIPTPDPNDVLIKVSATDSNPKDWKGAMMSGPETGMNQGDDIAGTIHSVGSSVYEFAPGDRVAGFHRMMHPHGSYAEYALAPASTTFRIPPNISFEAASTIPLAAMTAAIALFQHLELPLPWETSGKAGNTPIIIYGGASAVGAFALQFAKLAGLNPVITVAGNGVDFVRSLDAATHVVDYRKNDGKDVVSEILAALGGKTVLHAFDAVSGKGSWQNIIAVLGSKENGNSAGGHLNMLDPPAGNPSPVEQGEGPRDWGFPENVKYSRTFVASAYGQPHTYRTPEEASKDEDFAYVMYRYIGRLLTEGRFKPHRFEVLPGGLDAVEEGVKRLFENKVSGKKLVYRIQETSGAK